MKPASRLALVALLAIAAGLTWRTCQAPRTSDAPASSPAPADPAATASTSASTSAPADVVVLGTCDQQPDPPPLPSALSQTPTEVPGVIAALDATLNDAQKAWLRCFSEDQELIVRTHHGFGRWLRATLRLRTQPALSKALGARSPDDASALIVLIYVHHLRGDEIDVEQAQALWRRALEAAGVRR